MAQDRRLFAKEILIKALKETYSHEACCEHIVSSFQAKFGGNWNCATWPEGQGECEVVAKAEQTMRLKVRGQIFMLCEARDSLALPVALDVDQIQVD